MKPRRNHKLALLALTASLAFAAQAITIVNDPASPVDIVTAGYNGYTKKIESSQFVPSHTLEFSNDATITLAASAATNGVFELHCGIRATNSTITVEAESGIDTIRWFGGVQCDKVIVKGATAIVFGDSICQKLTEGKVNLAYFRTDVQFDGAENPSFTFTNAVTLAKAPTCAYTIAEGTQVAVASKNVLGSGDTFTLANYNITLLDPAGINADKIAVQTGRCVTLFPCNISYGSGVWKWAGTKGETIAYDFEMEEGSTLNLYGANCGHILSGNISGTAALSIATSADTAAKATLNFTGSVNLGGTVKLNNRSSFCCNGNRSFAFGDLTCADYADKGNTFTLKNGATASIGSLTGGIKVVGDSPSSFTVGALAANAVLDVDGTVKVVITRDADSTAQVNLLGTEGGWTVSGPSDAAVSVNLVPATTGLAITLGGKLALGDLGAAYSAVNLLSGAELAVTAFDTATKITGTGKLVYAGTTWQDKIDFWADASAGSACFQTVQDFAGSECTLDANKIVWWKDCRAEKRTGDDAYGLAMTRFAATQVSNINKYPKLYPDVVADQLNGKPIVKVSHSAQTRLGLLKLSTIIEENTKSFVQLSTKYAIVITRNIASGAGSAVLSSVNGVLAASAKGYNANIFTNETIVAYRDGAAIDPTTTTWGNSVWGLYSFTTADAQVNGIATLDKPNDSNQGGGFDYAEIMLFTEAPTETERKVIEEKLATKWGLTCSHSGTSEAVTLNVEVGGAASETALVEYPADEIPRAFTLNVNVPANFKCGVRYPIVKCASIASAQLGTVTGKSISGLTTVVEDGILYLTAPKAGLTLILR